MATMKFEVEKFDGRNSFSKCHIKMRALLQQQSLTKILDDKAPKWDDEEASSKAKEEFAALE